MSEDNIYKHIKYVGNRPKDDTDNHCRAKLAHLVKDVGCFHEICPEKLYLVYLAQNEDAKLFCEENSKNANNPFIFWGTHRKPNLSYEAFNMDFGPFNLATTHQFCSKLKVWSDTHEFRSPDKYIVIVLDDSDTKKKLNITFLVAVAAIVLLDVHEHQVIQRLEFYMMFKTKPGEPKKELVFNERKKFSDVSGNYSVMSVTLDDCIKAFYRAFRLKFYDYYDFDQAEYLFYETVMSGDLNWIVPGKILAFAGPSDKPIQSKVYHKHPPKFYHDYFKDHNVTTIIRLNEPEYKSTGFQEAGFDHHDLIFPDGYPPTSTIATKFIKIVNEAKGAVAVHCYAGIGRTGTLIAAYLMTKYEFTSQTAVAWTRICRPGSVIGEQQDWLFTKFDPYSTMRSLKQPTKIRKTKQDNSTELLADSGLSEIEKPELTTNITYAIAEKTYGQAKALLLTKSQKHRTTLQRPCTRKSSLLKYCEGTYTSKNAKAKTDRTLDLGKTIPLMLSLEDFKNVKDGQNPEFYLIKDGKYEWKVKFPCPAYVTLKHDTDRDMQASLSLADPYDKISREPLLDFRYVEEEGTGPDGSVRLKPVVYYSLVAW